LRIERQRETLMREREFGKRERELGESWREGRESWERGRERVRGERERATDECVHHLLSLSTCGRAIGVRRMEGSSSPAARSVREMLYRVV